MQCQIAVIGNGTVGKAAALGLAQAGLDVILVSPSTTPRPLHADWDRRVFALNHTARDLLTRLKVWDALDPQRIAPVESMHVTDEGGATVQLDAYSAYRDEMAWIVEDQNLNHALDNALRFAANLRVVEGSCVAMDADFSALTLHDGSTLQAELWVGADGAQSWLRNRAGIDLSYRSYQQRGVVCNFRCARAHHGVAMQWFTREQGIIALLPLPGQRVSLVWSAPDALASLLMQETTQQIAERLAACCAGQLGELTPLPPEQALAFPLRIIAPHRMVGPRLALVGDAAHVVHPLAGHGMNLGFGDVVALIETITQRETGRPCGDDAVLRRYARARKEPVLMMQLATDGLSRLFGTQLEPVRALRNFGMQVVNRAPFIKRQLIRQAMGR